MYDLSLRDFKILAELVHHKSLRSVGRALDIEPQHLSKLIKNIEMSTGSQLLLRSPRGVSPTDRALELSELAKAILKTLHTFTETESSSGPSTTKQLTMVSRVFMNAFCSPLLVADAAREFGNISFKFIDASPKKKEEWARQGLVDLVLSLGELDLGKVWKIQECGVLTWNFYVRSNHPLGTVTSIKKLVNYPFIGHAHVDEDRIVETSKLTPIKLQSKLSGIKTETSIASMNITAVTDQISYLPDLITKDMIKSQRIQKLKVRDLEGHKQIVYLAAHMDRVQQIHFEKITKILKHHLH